MLPADVENQRGNPLSMRKRIVAEGEPEENGHEKEICIVWKEYENAETWLSLYHLYLYSTRLAGSNPLPGSQHCPSAFSPVAWLFFTVACCLPSVTFSRLGLPLRMRPASVAAGRKEDLSSILWRGCYLEAWKRNTRPGTGVSASLMPPAVERGECEKPHLPSCLLALLLTSPDGLCLQCLM